jgi:hypothetical protein
MADVVSNLLNLPGLFVACVQDFEYIQFGRDFEGVHKDLVLRLDLLQTRLSRWGYCVGVINDQGELEFSERLEGCEPYLSHILKEFDHARDRVAKSKPVAIRYDEDQTESSVFRKKIQGWTLEYTKKWKSGRKRVEWALHDRKVLEGLICNIRTDIDDLNAVFPEDQAKQLLATQIKCCVDDVKELKGSELRDLARLAEVDDEEPMLETVKKEIQNRNSGSHSFIGNFQFETTTAESRNRMAFDVICVCHHSDITIDVIWVHHHSDLFLY